MFKTLNIEVKNSLDSIDTELEDNELELEDLGLVPTEGIAEPLPPEPDDYDIER